MFWNVAGLGNKDPEFWNAIVNYDFVGLVETWVEEKNFGKWKNILPKHYRWKWRPATKENIKGRAKGGILTGIRSEYEEEKSKITDEEMQERIIILNREKWKIITIYNPNGKEFTLKKLDENVEEIGEDCLIIGGDLNARTGEEGNISEKEEDVRKSKDNILNAEGKKLLELVRNRGWYIGNGRWKGDEHGEFTFVGANGRSVIDYVIGNKNAEERMNNMRILERIDSDHLPITISIKVNQIEKKKNITDRMIQDWSAEGKNKFQIALRKIIWETKMTVEDTIKELNSNITEAVVSRKIKLKNRVSQKWWDEECWRAKKKVNSTLRKWKKGEVTLEFLNAEKKRYKDFLKEKRRKEEINYQEELKSITNEREAWEHINKNRKTKTKICESIKMEEWKNYFQELLHGSPQAPKIKNVQRNCKEEDVKVTHEDVMGQIKKLKKGKSAGSDEIKNECWIYGGEKLSEKLTELIQKVWKGEGVPDVWKLAMIYPIFKKGEDTNTRNYRGISLLNTGYKIYTNILIEKLNIKYRKRKLYQTCRLVSDTGGVLSITYT